MDGPRTKTGIQERKALLAQGLKHCFACKRILPLADFNRTSKSSDGLQTYCRMCSRPMVRRAQAAWRKKDPLRARTIQRAWRAANPDAERPGRIAWYASHAEQERANARAWRLTHPGRAAAVNRAWRATNPQRYRDSNRHQAKLSKARRKGAVGTHTFIEWREKCELFANLCVYCGEARTLHREHKIPLIRGGTNSIENIVPACSLCNLKKGTRTAKEFLGLTA